MELHPTDRRAAGPITQADHERRPWLGPAMLAAAHLCAVIGTSPARAEPHIAIRAGLACSACHVNQTGGGKRNAMGVGYGLERLPQFKPPPEQMPDLFRGEVTDSVRLGADLRAVNVSRFTASDDTNTFDVQEGNLYLDLALLRARLRLYGDVQVAPGAARSREIFALIEQLPGNLYVKAGRFFAPFGWRLLDDDAFIRARTGFNFRSPDDGVEIGWQPGKFGTFLAVTNGNGGAVDDNTNKRVSLLSSWAGPRFQIGGSLASNKQGDVSSLLGGLLAGAKLHERLVALGEVDLVEEDDGALGTSTRSLLAYVEADLWVTDGLNLKTAFDYRDPDRSEEEDEENRVTVGAEWFTVPYLQFRVLWRRTDRPPVVHQMVLEDEREVVLEMHLYL